MAFASYERRVHSGSIFCVCSSTAVIHNLYACTSEEGSFRPPVLMLSHEHSVDAYREELIRAYGLLFSLRLAEI